MIAIIAGTGNLPLEACKILKNENKQFFVISLFPEDNAHLIKNIIKEYANIFTKEFYKAGEILKLLKEKKTKQVLFIGKVDKRNLFKKIKLDWLAIKLFASIAYKGDKLIMERLLEELKKENIQVINQNEILKSLLIKPGIISGKITKELNENIKFGMEIAQNLSFCDIGQTVIIKDKMIIAVEAIEGTDDCIKRGIALGEKDIIICKTTHKNKNKKYDMPTLGYNSLKDLKSGQIKAIAWQSDKTLIADKEKFINKAKDLGITLISI